MDFSQLSELPKSYIFPLVMGLVGVILFGYGLMQYFGNNQPQKSEILKINSVTINPVKTAKKLFIDIEGGVVKPGVYTMDTDSRMQDALIAAGGLSQTADRSYVEKHINLAAKITDGLKIYIPRVGEDILQSGAAEIASSQDQAGLLNINTASTTDLDGLPGIGAVTADKIIAGRPYGSIQELLDKKIVGQSVFAKIKDRITAN